MNPSQHCRCIETFANELRLHLLQLLRDGSQNVNALAAATGVERSRVSHALQQLRECQLVRDEKKGREILYSLNETPLYSQQGTFFDLIEQHAKTCCKTCKHGGIPFDGSN